MLEPTFEQETARVDAIGIKPPPAFSIGGMTAAGGASVMVLRGELDLAAAESIRTLVDGAGHPGLVLDLGGVTFVDSSALRELLHARLALAASGGRLVLAAVPRIVSRLLEITGTLELFETAQDRDAAVARLMPVER
jgi:anti-sigma B factor antagonist